MNTDNRQKRCVPLRELLEPYIEAIKRWKQQH